MKLKFIKHFSPRRFAAYVVLLGLNILIFGLTDPFRSRAIVVIGGFALLLIDITVVINWLLRLLGLLVPAILARQRRLTVVLSSFLVTLIALASIGQLSWFDGLIVIIVCCLGYFYVSYYMKPATSDS